MVRQRTGLEPESNLPGAGAEDEVVLAVPPAVFSGVAFLVGQVFDIVERGPAMCWFPIYKASRSPSPSICTSQPQTALRAGHTGRIPLDPIGKADYHRLESSRHGRGKVPVENLG